MKRFEDWPSRLDAYIESRRAMPFAWGATGNDCVGFCLGAVQAITGVEIQMPERSTALEAMREIEKAGGLGELLSATVLGPARQNWREARRGDVVLVEGRDGHRLLTMVCAGTALVGPGEEGMQSMPLRAAVLVWKVG